MRDPRTPSEQLEYGPLYARDFLPRNMAHIVSSSPGSVRAMRKWYGRYLSGLNGDGLGSEDLMGQVGWDSVYQDQHIYDLEREDDSFGSGIFDPDGRGGTANSDMGVFASHYGLPGYSAREVPFTVSRDITDITDDADVVAVPGGGMYYVERKGRLSGAAITGPTWRPPQIQPPGWTRFDQVYAMMQKRNQPDPHGTWHHADVPMGPPVPQLRPRSPMRPTWRVPATPREGVVPGVPAGMTVPERSIVHARQVPVPLFPPAQLAGVEAPGRPYLLPSYPPEEGPIPQVPSGTTVGSRQIVHATQVPVPIYRERVMRPVAAAAPDMPEFPEVGFQDTTNVAMQSIAVPMSGMSGFGHTDPRWSSLEHQRRFWGHPGGVLGQEAPPAVPVPAPAPVEEKKPASAAQLAFAGLLLGAATGLLVGALKKKT